MKYSEHYVTFKYAFFIEMTRIKTWIVGEPRFVLHYFLPFFKAGAGGKNQVFFVFTPKQYFLASAKV